MRVLVVEDEARIRSFIEKGLRAEGFAVDTAGNGEDALLAALTTSYHAIVLDIMIPGRDGLSVLRKIRRHQINTPVILATARDALEDKLSGLDLGADDYLAKPFHIDELTARLRAIIRRTGGGGLNLLETGDIRLNLATREVHANGNPIELTQREFNLLALLMRSRGRVYTRTQILESVWNYDFDPNTNLVDVYIKRLRQKLGPDTKPRIETVRGVGYRLGRAEK